MPIGETQPSQCFDACDTAGRGIDERLKAGKRLPVDHKASLVDLVFEFGLGTG
ncbi:hypothetical protein D3C81_1832820 [compost metagenome]